MRKPTLPSSKLWLWLAALGALLIAALGVALIAGSLAIQASATAYIVGEGHWSKAQQAAVNYLYRYSLGGEDADLQRALSALDVPLGDRDARLALDQTPPRLDLAAEGFRRGQNHPEDIPAMIWMYRHLVRAPFFRESVAIWIEADEHILELARIAAAMEQLWAQGRADSPEMIALQSRTLALDELLRPLELAFSSSLNAGSRWLRTVLIVVNAAGFVLLALLASWVLSWARRRIRQSEGHFRIAFSQAGVGMAKLDQNGGFMDANDTLCRLLGRSESELRSTTLADMLHPEDQSLAPSLAGEQGKFQGQYCALPLEMRLLRPDQSTIWARATLSDIDLPSEPRARTLLIVEDVSQAHRLSQELLYQASHDALTGLINRREIEARLQHMLADARQGGVRHALCFVDLDQFKIVNDTCGHSAGDELLRRLARELPECLRPRDVLGRLGGDEFAVLLERTRPEGAVRAAEKLQQALRNFVFPWEGRSFNLTASIGIVEIDEHAPDVGSLLRAADTACYLAKEEGRNRIRVYVEGDQVMERRRGEMEWVGEIRRALSDNRLHLYAQRIEPTAADGGLRYEVLVRLLDGAGRLCGPGEFLPAAERYGQATALDRRVVETTLQQLALHPQHLQALHLCHINVSAQSMGDADFRQHIADLLDASTVPGSKLCFELTETAAIGNLSQARRFMETVRSRGCRVAMDDFGSGLSSFAYLKNLDFDILKIDGAFVRDVLDDPVDQAVVRSIREIGRALGKETIAEWVESTEVRAVLARIGVDSVQGHAVHEPCPLQDLLALHAATNRAAPR